VQSLGIKIASAEASIEKLRDQLNALETRLSVTIDTQDTLIRSIGKGRILATAQIRNGNLVSKSDDEIIVDRESGFISFPNPKRVPFTPIVTDNTTATIGDVPYVTDIVSPNKFRVYFRGPDRVTRPDPPREFSVVIVAFDDSIQKLRNPAKGGL
jgi:hypothetical protein